jgi:SAM-dependent methyltransferase
MLLDSERTQIGFAPFKELILPIVDRLPPGNLVLDIGCQAGDMVSLIAPRFNQAYGIDIASYENDWKRYPSISFKAHDIDASPLPFRENSVSLVLCTNVFEHVFDVFGLASEIGRVLQPGGYCIIMVPNAAYLKHIFSLLKGRVPRTGSQRVPFLGRDGWDGCHLHYFTIKELKWLLSQYQIHTLLVRSSGRFGFLRWVWPNVLFADIILLGQSIKRT